MRNHKRLSIDPLFADALSGELDVAKYPFQPQTLGRLAIQAYDLGVLRADENGHYYDFRPWHDVGVSAFFYASRATLKLSGVYLRDNEAHSLDIFCGLSGLTRNREPLITVIPNNREDEEHAEILSIENAMINRSATTAMAQAFFDGLRTN